jgi:flagellar secretion chaperone FliS
MSNNMQMQNAYLESQVNSATPQKLRLMLIEGAIRFARLTIKAMEEDNDADCCEAASRCRSIVSELIGSIHNPEEDLYQRIIALYVFIFQRVTEGQLAKDIAAIQEAISVLELERQTWQDICTKHPEKLVGEMPMSKPPTRGAKPPPTAIRPTGTPVIGTQFSFDA